MIPLQRACSLRSARLTLEDVVAAELGDVRMVGDEVLQEAGELVALPQGHVAAQKVLVHHPQVEVVAEGVHVHQVSHLVALLREEHGQLQDRQGGLGHLQKKRGLRRLCRALSAGVADEDPVGRSPVYPAHVSRRPIGPEAGKMQFLPLRSRDGVA